MNLDVAIPCAGCGYDLRGSPTTGVCPECGFDISESIQRNQPDYESDARTAFMLGVVCFALALLFMATAVRTSSLAGGNWHVMVMSCITALPGAWFIGIPCPRLAHRALQVWELSGGWWIAPICALVYCGAFVARMDHWEFMVIPVCLVELTGALLLVTHSRAIIDTEANIVDYTELKTICVLFAIPIALLMCLPFLVLAGHRLHDWLPKKMLNACWGSGQLLAIVASISASLYWAIIVMIWLAWIVIGGSRWASRRGLPLA